MHQLNLPSFEHKVKNAEGKIWIFDGIRKKFVVLTSEEWVRQHLVNYLINYLSYPRALTRIESGLHFNQLSKRSDVVVYDREGKPWMVIECKSPEQTINEKTASQASMYNVSLKARYIALTNGLNHFCFEVDHVKRIVSFCPDFPPYPGSD